MRNRAATLFVSLVVLCLANFASAGDSVLAENGQSAYQIVLAGDTSPSTKYAAEELQKFLAEMTGAKLPIVSDQEVTGPKEIVLGDNRHFRDLKTDIDVASLGKEGYVIRTLGDHLVIVGSAVRGNLYGVYGLLEDHLGCRWFTRDCSRIPKSARLVLPKIDDRQIPALEYREPFLAECLNNDWCARNRMNSSFSWLQEKHGGKGFVFAKDFSFHTFAHMVPPEKYFGDHPEYFAMLGGQRIKEQQGLPAQLCCTNPDVIRICTEAVRAAMGAQPSATVFSVSPNDSPQTGPNQCECAQCQALAQEEDSQMAPVLQLVNHVAEAVEKEYPDKVIITLAYHWSRRAPKHIRPRPNVVIWLCSNECCFSHPLATCDSAQNQAFRADMEAWAKISQRLWIWDYATDFSAYLLPFPNQRVRGPNIRFFVEHNVTGIFEEDSFNSADSEMAALGGYIMAKCLWNPNCDTNTVMNEFLEGYYGKASVAIRAYIDLIHDHVERGNIHVRIRATADGPNLTDDLLIQANQLWQQAEDSVAGDPLVLRRVRIGRLSVDYAILERARSQVQKKLPAAESFVALVKARFQPFSDVLQMSKLARLRENPRVDKQAYLHDLAKDLGLDISQ